MGAPIRDNTDQWRLPEAARPPLLGELVERIDEALATARASEAAVMTVGAAALDAAEQARRAASLAERASAAIASRQDPERPPGVAPGRTPARRAAGPARTASATSPPGPTRSPSACAGSSAYRSRRERFVGTQH